MNEYEMLDETLKYLNENEISEILTEETKFVISKENLNKEMEEKIKSLDLPIEVQIVIIEELGKIIRLIIDKIYDYFKEKRENKTKNEIANWIELKNILYPKNTNKDPKFKKFKFISGYKKEFKKNIDKSDKPPVANICLKNDKYYRQESDVEFKE